MRPEHVQELARPVLEHRLLPSPDQDLYGHGVGPVLDEVLETTPVPGPLSLGTGHAAG